MKIITIETLKTFLDELNKKYGTEFYSKQEIDEKLKSSGGSVEDFYQWLRERNYDLTNFQGLEGVFPVKDFPELKVNKVADGDTQIGGTGAPNAVVEYDGKRAQIGNGGHFLLEGISPLVAGDLIEITYYDYAGRKKTFSIAVGNLEPTVPDGTTEIDSDIVKQYNLNRAGKLIFPASVKVVAESAFEDCTELTSVMFPACTSVGVVAFGGCTALTSVSLPACTSVEASTFWGCTALTSVSLPECTDVAEEAFYNCASLTSVSLPACTSVDRSAFLDCRNLQTVVLSDSWRPNSDTGIPTTATVYNQDKTKKVEWNTKRWVNV